MGLFIVMETDYVPIIKMDGGIVIFTQKEGGSLQ